MITLKGRIKCALKNWFYNKTGRILNDEQLNNIWLKINKPIV